METKEQRKQRHHKYYEANKEKIKVMTRAYQQSEKGKQLAQANYQKNRTKRLAYQKAYAKTSRGKENARLYWQRRKLRIQNENKNQIIQKTN